MFGLLNNSPGSQSISVEHQSVVSGRPAQVHIVRHFDGGALEF